MLNKTTDNDLLTGQTSLPQDELMEKLLMKLKIVINYLKILKNQNYTMPKIFIMRKDIN